ncbi:MAG TPA: c-type cytochrome [Devosia sp.]|jgi:mono/diheme cytochrome c family protein|nr:c-type cytochrome [Devosia sp.]
MLKLGLLAVAALAFAPAAAMADDVSVANGLRISIVGGCNDCHTVGYAESNGKIDPDAALKGNPVGYGGPWGVNYAKNLRIDAAKMSEDDWVKFLQTFQAGPPMPWYNVHAFSEAEMRSLYQYIKSLGAPGDPAPADVPPGQKPTTPFITMAPPTMPG